MNISSDLLNQNYNHATNTNPRHLQLGLSDYQYADLYQPQRLAQLHDEFLSFLKTQTPTIHQEFSDYQTSLGVGMHPEQISNLLVAVAPFVGEFVAILFQVENERQQQMQVIQTEIDVVFKFRTEVALKSASLFKGQNVADWDIATLQADLESLLSLFKLDNTSNSELAVAQLAITLWQCNQHLEQIAKGQAGEYPQTIEQLTAVLAKLKSSDPLPGFLSQIQSLGSLEFQAKELLVLVQRWCFAALQHPDLQKKVQAWMSFKQPAKTDFEHLVHHAKREREGFETIVAQTEHLRRRDGFGLTDTRGSEREILYEVDHCIYCHDRDTDSCSKGMRNRKDNTYKINPLGVTITGCPLEEKISEMHLVKRQGDNIGALALVMIDNPMCPGTGHRICNDCMKGCIYQKTEPVNIPQIETNVLTDVLFMPWGFEIYGLLTRWNPLNIKRPYALPYNGKNVLVVGLGPAGYTLAHYLLNEGFAVTGIDGLKIEPLPKELTGDVLTPPNPVHDFEEIYEALDKRVMLGFGGVAEYGITVRWDKNFLKVIYLTLARRNTFASYGGIRFGGTLNIDDTWELGFHHIAIASGAGKPTIIDLENNLLRGIRKASDFLMALQLSGAAKESTLANLQVRLPAGVIGGGLTATDTATELLAYYPVQVEKILKRYETLVREVDEPNVRATFDQEELVILDEFLAHGRMIRAERERAKLAGELPDFQTLLNQWGGVTMFYRKGMKDSPAYRQNHEEICKALEEGIQWAEGMSPVSAHADDYGHLRAVTFEKLTLEESKWRSSGQKLEVPIRSLFIAAGTSPNTIYESEYPNTFVMDGNFYQRSEPEWSSSGLELKPVHDKALPKIGKPAPFTSYQHNGKYITYYGDNHPVYAGNVVKAMASAKHGYPYIVKLFEADLRTLNPTEQVNRDQNLVEFKARLDDALLATVVAVNRLTPTIIEVIVRAPRQAEKFEPGQFYRVQNFEALAPTINGTVLAAEGLALTGAWVDKEKGLISLIALEMGSSSRLCATWKPGEPVVVMGVTGAPTEIPRNETILLAGGGLGNAVLFSIGKALRAAGNRVIYFAGYKYGQDVFKVDEIEAASDVIIWSVDKTPGAQPIAITRPQDKTFVGNILEAMLAYSKGELGETSIRLEDVGHMVVIGSDRMMAAIKEARHSVLAAYLKRNPVAIGSINSPMQCMMKGVCAQCMCKHIDPETGKEYFVYSCYNQDQELDRVDFVNLNARLRQNSVQEKLSNRWLDYLLSNRVNSN